MISFTTSRVLFMLQSTVLYHPKVRTALDMYKPPKPTSVRYPSMRNTWNQVKEAISWNLWDPVMGYFRPQPVKIGEAYSSSSQCVA
ncbi:hypothetical protein M422DRAFT_35061 [Sphaerobolus stellatus SS14]|uniref:Unplaced genomic scaffold SPHSTscaffold_123, whole genome shotgun sequence n=1 Tax=Sphaerobolus stellatus (strain SS14) TaxID=990650 RepID=A0A0C9UZ38_SPHS4|nr:hypothetical protein M422DRAFT_35061 [Sphaerobolus stellatus SS14]